MLLKRSVVLAGKKPIGYVNFIRFGNTLGAKLRLNVGMKGVLSLSVNGERQFFYIDGEKQELDLNLPFDANSVLGGVLANEKGEVIAWGGKSEDRRSWERAYFQWREDTEKAEAAFTMAKSTETKEMSEPSAEQTAESATAEPVQESAQAAEVSGADRDFQAATANAQETEVNMEEAQTENPVKEEPMNEEPAAEEPVEIIEETPLVAEEIPSPIETQPQTAERKERFLPFEMPLNENFYAGIRSRLEEALTVNPREEDLERLIPESRWVKVFYEGDDYYVIGEVREDGAPRLVGYGVPGVADVVPPEEVRDVTDFLPVSENSGYWLLFQSAENGEILPN